MSAASSWCSLPPLLVAGLLELGLRRRSVAALHAWPVLLAVAAGTASTLPALAWTAFKVGALSYGGGFVIIPLMHGDAVDAHGWMTDAEFTGAVAFGQLTPGPVTQTVALAEINAASDVQRAKVSMDDATATLVWSGELGKSALLVDGLGSLPSDKVYELWYIGEGGPVSAGTFSAANGTTWRVLDGAMSAGDKVGVTVEPQGGSKQPTTDPIMVIETA